MIVQEALDLFRRRKGAHVIFGYKCDDLNIKDNEIIVVSDTEFYSYAKSAKIYESAEGELTRVWIAKDAIIFRTNEVEGTSYQLPSSTRSGEFADFLTNKTRVLTKDCMLSRLRAIKSDVDVGTQISDVTLGGRNGVLEILRYCSGCSTHTNPDDWFIAEGGDNAASYQSVGQVLKKFGGGYVPE